MPINTVKNIMHSEKHYFNKLRRSERQQKTAFITASLQFETLGRYQDLPRKGSFTTSTDNAYNKILTFFILLIAGFEQSNLSYTQNQSQTSAKDVVR